MNRIKEVAAAISVSALALSVTACNTTSSMNVPKVKVTKAPSIATPVRNQTRIALGKVVVDIPRGRTIAHFPAGGLLIDGTLCNYRHIGTSTLEWTSGSQYFGDWRSEFGTAFFNVLSDRGVNVVGDPKDLFRRDVAAGSAELMVGARIHQIKGNFCEEHYWWDGRPLGKYSGEMYVEVEWSLYSTLYKQVVAKTGTKGAYKQARSSSEGIALAFLGAFEQATENLLTEKAFVDAVSQRPATQTASAAAAAGNPSLAAAAMQGRATTVRAPRPFGDPIARSTEKILPAVVTVRSGQGHGSGFLIGRAGYLLTNAHVVGEADRVQAVFRNGVEVTGAVVSRDRRRDVALVKLPVRGRNVLPIASRDPVVLEEVYAIGSPINEELQATVTKGVVSAVRVDNVTRLRYIQSDVAISPGNSGGPLLDRSGNVIGIAVAGIVGSNAQNLNLFVPIAEALAAVRVSLDRGDES